MAFRDWTEAQKEEFDNAAIQDIFADAVSSASFSEEQIENAQELFEAGWLTWPISQEEAENYRQQFYDAIYMSEDLFRALGYWQEFRELYDTVDTA